MAAALDWLDWIVQTDLRLLFSQSYIMISSSICVTANKILVADT